MPKIGLVQTSSKARGEEAFVDFNKALLYMQKFMEIWIIFASIASRRENHANQIANGANMSKYLLRVNRIAVTK